MFANGNMFSAKLISNKIHACCFCHSAFGFTNDNLPLYPLSLSLSPFLYDVLIYLFFAQFRCFRKNFLKKLNCEIIIYPKKNSTFFSTELIFSNRNQLKLAENIFGKKHFIFKFKFEIEI